MIAARVDDGEPVASAVLATVDFYSERTRARAVTAETQGIADVVAAVEAWRALPAEGADPNAAQRRARASSELRAVFRAASGGAYRALADSDAWLEVDTSAFDLDPADYLERVAARFGVATPPYGTNAEILEFVLARWRG